VSPPLEQQDQHISLYYNGENMLKGIEENCKPDRELNYGLLGKPTIGKPRERWTDRGDCNVDGTGYWVSYGKITIIMSIFVVFSRRHVFVDICSSYGEYLDQRGMK
jgi:hypothetical protein